jgi:hypothetical protein
MMSMYLALFPINFRFASLTAFSLSPSSTALQRYEIIQSTQSKVILKESGEIAIGSHISKGSQSSIVANAQGRMVAILNNVATKESYVSIISTKSLKVIKQVKLPMVAAISWSPAGSTLAYQLLTEKIGILNLDARSPKILAAPANVLMWDTSGRTAFTSTEQRSETSDSNIPEAWTEHNLVSGATSKVQFNSAIASTWFRRAFDSKKRRCPNAFNPNAVWSDVAIFEMGIDYVTFNAMPRKSKPVKSLLYSSRGMVEYFSLDPQIDTTYTRVWIPRSGGVLICQDTPIAVDASDEVDSMYLAYGDKNGKAWQQVTASMPQGFMRNQYVILQMR